MDEIRRILNTAWRHSAPFLKRFGAGVWKAGSASITALQADGSPQSATKFNTDGNVPIVISEIRVPPVAADRHEFPSAPAPVTRFEDFNRRLFILDLADVAEPWPSSTPNDYPTLLRGPLEWCEREVVRRLRPFYPVVIDELGYWAGASARLEITPDFADPVVNAYLALGLARRPVVVSIRNLPTTQHPKSLKLLRYQFADYLFEIRFLDTYQQDLLYQLLLSFTDAPEKWFEFSPARLRKLVFDRHRVVSEQRQKLEEELTRGAEQNRFASLWQLKDEQQPIDEKAATIGRESGARS